MNNVPGKARHVPVTTENLENLLLSLAEKSGWRPCQKVPPWWVYYRAGQVGFTAYEYTKRM